MLESAEWSELTVALVRGRSRLTASKSRQPLKILNPATNAGSCHAVLSSYGGGLVAGDAIRLQVRAEAGTCLLLSSQANTRIFRSDTGAVAEQHLAGTLAAGALVVSFPDPVVLQEGSRYRQLQHWQLAPDALLLAADWFHSGRMDRGEQFVFSEFHSELRVSVADQTVLLDRFTFRPAEHIATSPAHFADYQTALSIYLVGAPAEARFQQLAAALLALKQREALGLHARLAGQDYVLTVAQARPEVYVVRALGRSRQALQPLAEEIMRALATPELLGFDAWARKY